MQRFLAVICFVGFSLCGYGAPLVVVNPGFEDTSGSTQIFNEFSFGPFSGWDLYDPEDITNGGAGPTFFIGTLAPQILEIDPEVYQFFPDGAPEGSRVAIAFNYAGSGNMGEYGLQQTLSDTLQPNTRYDLSVLVGNIASGVSVSQDFFNLDGFPGYRVDLLAGSTVIASDNNSLAGSIPEGGWGTSSISYTTGETDPLLGQSLGIRLVNLNVVDPDFPDADLEVDFDSVLLTATVIPEPRALLLLGFCVLAFSFRRCLKSRSGFAFHTESR